MLADECYTNQQLVGSCEHFGGCAFEIVGIYLAP
jgi:hypothetical protein